jgi:uncharacterized protein (DUF302 family)
MMTDLSTTQLGLTVRLHTNFDDAVARATAALKTEGFGVLTEIDVKETLKKKLDVNFRPYKILGACNPPLAYRALNTAPEVGLLLPCNAVVSYVEDNMTEVAIIDPLSMLGFVDHPDLEPVAEEARTRLDRVVKTLQSS